MERVGGSAGESSCLSLTACVGVCLEALRREALSLAHVASVG